MHAPYKTSLLLLLIDVLNLQKERIVRKKVKVRNVAPVIVAALLLLLHLNWFCSVSVEAMLQLLWYTQPAAH